MSAPCSKCHKRHGRSPDHGPSGAPKPARPNRAFVLMASLLVGTAAASSLDVASSPLVGIRGGGNVRKTADAVSFIDTTAEMGVRRIQEEQDVHDHGDEEHHDEEGSEVNVFVDSGEMDHEDHAHEDEVLTEDANGEDHEGESLTEDHDGHDHGEDDGHADEEIMLEEDHDGHDHEDLDEHDEDMHEEDHDGHEHEDHDEDMHEEDHDGHDHGEHEEDMHEEDHDGHDHEEDMHEEDGHDGHAHSASEFETESITSREEAVSKPWGPVILATFIVNCAALTGLLLLLSPAIRKGLLARSSGETYSHGKLIDIVIPSFAVGALMATAFFLVLPEALHLIEGSHSAEEGGGADDHSGHNHRSLQDGHDGHGNDNAEGIAFAKWGCGILGGFLLPVFLSILFHHDELDEEESALLLDEDECKSCKAENDIESSAVPQDRGDVSTAVVVATNDSDSVIDADDEVQGSGREQFQDEPIEPIRTQTKTFINYRLGASIIIGDAFHNFADGLFIGAAFLSCSWATALSITAVSLFHELAGELADFILLTRYVGFTPTKACVLNFTSGLAVCLGGITVLATQPSDEVIGILLAIAGGVYINIAACESMPRIDASSKERNDRALTLLSLIIGTVPIGLILLDHKHC